jgi:hypothetical protein
MCWRAEPSISPPSATPTQKTNRFDQCNSEQGAFASIHQTARHGNSMVCQAGVVAIGARERARTISG